MSKAQVTSDSDDGRSAAQSRSRAELLAENAALQAQVDLLTRQGHELVGARTRMESLLHNAAEAIIQFDEGDNVIAFNRAAEHVFGFPEIELMYRSADHLFRFPADYDGGLRNRLARYCADNPDSYGNPLVGLCRDGSERLLTVSVAQLWGSQMVLFDDRSQEVAAGEPVLEAFMCILSDVTERKRVDRELQLHRTSLQRLVDERTEQLRAAVARAEQANRAKSDFLASMSHELRTPMHAILSYSDLGMRKHATAAPQKLAQYFERIQAAGNRLVGLIDDLLDLAKIEAGKLAYEPVEADLGAVVAEVLDEFEALIAARGLRVQFQRGGAARARFDVKRMGQVVRNLMSNAIKFTPPAGTIRLSLQRLELAGRGPALQMVVSDEGCGLAGSEHDTIFERFAQGNRGRDQAQGTGLGLAIARQIVTAHGGEIHAGNNAAGGAEFRFCLPVEFRGKPG